MKDFKHVVSSLLMVLMVVSCHEDVTNDNGDTTTTIDVTVPNVYNEVSSSLVGYVFTDDNVPVSEAQVSLYSGSTITDEFGLFSFDDVGLDALGTVVSVTKDGLRSGSIVLYPSERGVAGVSIYMSQEGSDVSFANEEGGVATFNNEGVVTFAPGTFVATDGSAYEGDVSIDLLYYSAFDVDFVSQSFGGLRGIDSDGRDRILGAVAGLQVFASGHGQQSIECGPTNIYTIRLPIPPALISSASAQSKLWWFNGSSEKYEQVGDAIREGGFYSATSDRTGIFLVAEDYPLTTMCAKIVDQDDLSVSGYRYTMIVDDLVCGVGVTDSEGLVCSVVPAGQEMSLVLYHPICNTIVLDAPIGSSDEPIYISDLKIDGDRVLRSGQVLCDGVAASNATIFINSDDYSYPIATNGDGRFTVDIAHLMCNDVSSFEIIAIHDGVSSNSLQLDESTPVDLSLDVCKTECAYSVSYLLSRMDYCSSGDYDVATVQVSGGSGSFSYIWSNGTTGAVNSDLVSGGNLCVTIQDLMTGCTAEYCETIPSYQSLEIMGIRSFNIQCQQNSGQLDIDVDGGVTPYEYEWTGDNGFASFDADISNLSPGSYNVVVRDAEGCTAESQAEIFNVLNALNSEINEECESSEIVILEDPGYGPYQYVWSTGSSSGNSLTIFSGGSYAVTVSDQNGCTRSKSFEISDVGSGIDFSALWVCSDSSIDLLSVDPGYDYALHAPILTGPLTLDVVEASISLDLFEVGYSFDIEVLDPTIGCSRMFDVSLPYFSGLSITHVVDSSCSDCDDGQIVFSVDDMQPCSGGCSFEEVLILDKLTGEDVTDNNASAELPTGTYYVVATNADGGCYIAHEEVIVD